MQPVNILDPRVRILTPKERRKVEIQQIWASTLREVANRHLVPPGLIAGRLKQPKVVAARDEFILRVWRTGRFSKSEIARRLGLHHTSICEAVRRQSDRVAS